MQRLSNQKRMFTESQICPIFSQLDFQQMLFWLLKDAQLACERCPFEALLTPFWSPTKHLLKSSLITHWFTNSYKLTFYTYFSPLLGTFYLKYCNGFSSPRSNFFTVPKRTKHTFFTLLLPSFWRSDHDIKKIVSILFRTKCFYFRTSKVLIRSWKIIT